MAYALALAPFAAASLIIPSWLMYGTNSKSARGVTAASPLAAACLVCSSTCGTGNPWARRRQKLLSHAPAIHHTGKKTINCRT